VKVEQNFARVEQKVSIWLSQTLIIDLFNLGGRIQDYAGKNAS
jgi:hypothetical protein